MAKKKSEETSSGSSSEKSIACDCKHDFQDEVYGKGRRAFTIGGGKGVKKKRCTVCGKEKG